VKPMLLGKINVRLSHPIFVLPHSFRLKYILYVLTGYSCISSISVSNIYPVKWWFSVKKRAIRDENNVSTIFAKPVPYVELEGYFYIYGKSQKEIIKEVLKRTRKSVMAASVTVTVDSAGLENINENHVKTPYNMTVITNKPASYQGPPEKLFIEKNGRILVPVAHLTPHGKVIAYQPLQALPSDKTISIQSTFGTQIANPIVPFPPSHKLVQYLRNASEFLEKFISGPVHRGRHRYPRYGDHNRYGGRRRYY